MNGSDLKSISRLRKSVFLVSEFFVKRKKAALIHKLGEQPVSLCVDGKPA